ncbi:hypothetical protein [Alistipes putredinis]|uniref:hypothetical protein n=1 Tax=Alistipes putredinis TaxID=28117 RepID=UPI0024B0DB49|nr:hypothetical protein [Alistipes putredinis]
MKKLIFGIVCGLSLCSATSWNRSLIVQGDFNAAIHNVILDFVHTCEQQNEYEVFQVFNLGNYYLDDNLYYRIYIGGMIGPFPIENPHRLLGTKSYIPTRFEEQNGKLFLWDDKDAVITSELLDAMRKYNCIDSLTNCLTINDRNDGVTYIVDARNLSKYVKINGGNIKNSAYYRSLYFMKLNAL